MQSGVKNMLSFGELGTIAIVVLVIILNGAGLKIGADIWDFIKKWIRDRRE